MILYLTGFMGSGKTTVGRILAEKTGSPFFDLDEKIVELTGTEITEIFRKQGESGFRQIETKALLALIAAKNGIIALGGGALKTEKNRQIVRSSGTLIYLKSPLPVLINRIRHSQDRPLFNRIKKNPSKEEELTRLFNQREPGYLKADIIIETGEITPVDAANNILREAKNATY